MKSLGVTRPGWIAYLIAAVVIVLDQLTKAYVLYVVRLPDARHIDLSPVLDLTMVWNKGMSFGLLRAHGDLGRWFLTVFAIGVACAPLHATRAQALVERADAAMYAAKRLGHPYLWDDALDPGPADPGRAPPACGGRDGAQRAFSCSARPTAL